MSEPKLFYPCSVVTRPTTATRMRPTPDPASDNSTRSLGGIAAPSPASSGSGQAKTPTDLTPEVADVDVQFNVEHFLSQYHKPSQKKKTRNDGEYLHLTKDLVPPMNFVLTFTRAAHQPLQSPQIW